MRARHTVTNRLSILLVIAVLALFIKVAADDLGGGMSQFFQDLANQMDTLFAEITEQCDRAAANIGGSIIQDTGPVAMGKEFAKAAGNAIKQIASLGEGEIEDLAEQKADEAADAYVQRVNDALQKLADGVQPEVYTRTSETYVFGVPIPFGLGDIKKNGCDYELTATFDLKNHIVEVVVDGDCHCTDQSDIVSPKQSNVRPIKLGKFHVRVWERVSIDPRFSGPNSWNPILRFGDPNVEAKGYCCETGYGTTRQTYGTGGGGTDGGDIIGGGGGTTGGGGGDIGTGGGTGRGANGGGSGSGGGRGSGGGGGGGGDNGNGGNGNGGGSTGGGNSGGGNTGGGKGLQPKICPECLNALIKVDALRNQLVALEASFSGLYADLDAKKSAQKQAQQKVTDLQNQLSAQEGTGGSAYDPATGNTTSAITQADGRVLITVKDSAGNDVVAPTYRDRKDTSQIQQALTAAQAALDQATAAVAAAEAAIQAARAQAAALREQLQDAIIALADCLETRCSHLIGQTLNDILTAYGLPVPAPHTPDNKQAIEYVSPKPTGEVSLRDQDLGSEQLAEITIPPTQTPTGTVAWENLGRLILGWLSPHSTFASMARLGPSAAPRYIDAGSGGIANGVVKIFFVATGRSTGQVLQLRALNTTGKPVKVSAPDGLVLEPLQQAATQAAADKVVRIVPGLFLNGFCVNFLKQVPVAGTMYRIADRATQEKYAPIARIMRAARSLTTSNQLHPDSDPQEYSDAIKQLAIWSRLERWTPAEFEQHFVERTHKNVASVGAKWTRDIERQVHDMAAGRKRDVDAVLAAADAPVRPRQ